MWYGTAVMLLGIVGACAESGAVTGPPTLHPSAPSADIEMDMPTQCGVGSIACAGLWFDSAESGYWT